MKVQNYQAFELLKMQLKAIAGSSPSIAILYANESMDTDKVNDVLKSLGSRARIPDVDDTITIITFDGAKERDEAIFALEAINGDFAVERVR